MNHSVQRRTNGRQIGLLAIVLLVTLVWAVLPIFIHGIRGGYDPNFHTGRIVALADGIRAGHFPNPIGYRYLNGLGYGVGFFYGNFWLYPFALLVVLGVPASYVYAGLLLVLVIGTMAAIGVTTYVITRRLAAVAVAVPVYVLNNYVISVLFGRAAIGEAMALVWMPLVVLGTWAVWHERRYGWALLGASMAALLVSHLLSFVIAVVFLLLLLLVSVPRLVRKPRVAGQWVLAGVFGAGLAAAFLLPLIQQFAVQTYKDTAVDAAGRAMILGSPINIGSALTPWAHQMQGATGSLLLLVGLVAVVAAIVGWPGRPDGFIGSLIIVAVPIGLLIYSVPFVAALYRVVPGIKVFQASWRFNTVFIPVLTVVIADWVDRVGARWVPVVLILLNLAVYLPAFQTQMAFVHGRAASTRWVAYSISMGEYLPVAFAKHYEPWTTPAKILAAEPGTKLRGYDAQQITVRASSAWSGRPLTVPKIYYEGYRYVVMENGATRKTGAVEKGKKGLGVVPLPAYSGSVDVVITYHTTLAAKVGFAVSGVTLIGGGVGLVYTLRRRRDDDEPVTVGRK